MTNKFLHDELFRTPASFARIRKPSIAICGAGALGSNLADNLVRQGVENLRVIDKDRIEEHNVGTQLYCVTDVGGWKVEVLKHQLFRAVEIEIDAVRKELSQGSVRKLLKGCDLVIDAMDNRHSRQLIQDFCRGADLPCLHVGLSADYCEIVWDEAYRVPRDVTGDVCDYPLARNIVLLAVAIASECIVTYLIEGTKRDFAGTLGDMKITEFNP